MKLPCLDRAEIDIRKIKDYALNLDHPEGRHKAKVFRAALGLTADSAEWLARAIIDALPFCEATLLGTIPWGHLYKVDVRVRYGSRAAIVRTGWICHENAAKLTTCYVVGERDETA